MLLAIFTVTIFTLSDTFLPFYLFTFLPLIKLGSRVKVMALPVAGCTKVMEAACR